MSPIFPQPKPSDIQPIIFDQLVDAVLDAILDDFPRRCLVGS